MDWQSKITTVETSACPQLLQQPAVAVTNSQRDVELPNMQPNLRLPGRKYASSLDYSTFLGELPPGGKIQLTD